MRRRKTSVTWANGQSISSWVDFGSGGPVSFSFPAAMDGVRLVVLTADAGADGNADAGNAEAAVDIDGNAVGMTIVLGDRCLFGPDALRGQGYLALQSVDAGGAPVAQTAARTGAWRFLEP